MQRSVGEARSDSVHVLVDKDREVDNKTIDTLAFALFRGMSRGAALGSRTPDLRITSRPAGQRIDCHSRTWGLDSRVWTQRRHGRTLVRGQVCGQGSVVAQHFNPLTQGAIAYKAALPRRPGLLPATTASQPAARTARPASWDRSSRHGTCHDGQDRRPATCDRTTRTRTRPRPPVVSWSGQSASLPGTRISWVRVGLHVPQQVREVGGATQGHH